VLNPEVIEDWWKGNRKALTKGREERKEGSNEETKERRKKYLIQCFLFHYSFFMIKKTHSKTCLDERNVSSCFVSQDKDVHKLCL
jgi:hypothetical protein